MVNRAVDRHTACSSSSRRCAARFHHAHMRPAQGNGVIDDHDDAHTYSYRHIIIIIII